MRSFRLIRLAFALIFFAPAPALAQFASPGGACSPNGILANSGAFLTCIGGVWVASQIVMGGVTNGGTATAGTVGEIISSGAVSGVTMTSGSYKTIASITLTPGVWEIHGSITLSSGTLVVYEGGDISTTTNSSTALSPDVQAGMGMASVASPYASFPVGVTVVNITSSTTYYLVGMFTGTGVTGGGIISAVRIR